MSLFRRPRALTLDLDDTLWPVWPAIERAEAVLHDWLKAHANRFHFELSFPQGNRQGVSYEPWHWRFEGSAEALKIFESAQRLSR
mgnify:CR=1 FL=1